MIDKIIKVAVGGGFDPLHEGHCKHMRQAKELGNYLIVMINPDMHMLRKKGFCAIPLKERIESVSKLSYVDEIVVNIDSDGTCAKTLAMIHPDIFAKGGDRTPDNMPDNEIACCKKLGIPIVYGMGAILNSSTKIAVDLYEQMNSTNSKLIYFEPAGQILSSHKSVFAYPPMGYKFILREDNIGSKMHKLLNTNLYKFGVASLPWHIIKPYLEKFTIAPVDDCFLTFSWNHVIFRNEPWIIHVEWPEMLAGFSKFWFKRMRGLIEKKLSEDNCRKIIVWSEVCKQSFLRNYNCKAFLDKIEVIPLAMSSHPKFVKNYNKEKVTFLSVCATIKGREDYNFHMKGGKEVLEAFDIISKKFNNVELILISEIPKDYIHKFSANEKIRLITDRVSPSEMEKYYSNADVFLFPGHDTPFGVILEAMSFELPVIVTDVYGNKEIVSDKETGFVIMPSKLVDYFDADGIATRPMTGPKRIKGGVLRIDWDVVHELSDKMEHLIVNRELRIKMGKAARDSVENGMHSITYRNRKLKKIFDEVM